MPESNRKPLMRSLGEFFGHLAKAVRTDPRRTVIRRRIELEQRGSLTLRRTTIEEIEVRGTDRSASNADAGPPT